MIQKIIFISLVSLLLFSCNQDEQKKELSSDMVFNPNTAQENKKSDKPGLPQMTFEYLDFDFGVIFQGETVIHKFKFTNTGSSALIISDVSATCGCTIPTYTKKPISAGDSGFIEVKFNSAGRQGIQHKSVNILANTQPNRIQLTFVAEIEVPK